MHTATAPTAPPTVAVNQPAKVPPMIRPNRQRIGMSRRRDFIFSETGILGPPPGGMEPGLTRPMMRTVTHRATAVMMPGMMPPIRAVPTLMVTGATRQNMIMPMEGGIRVDRAPEAATQPREYLRL